MQIGDVFTIADHLNDFRGMAREGRERGKVEVGKDFFGGVNLYLNSGFALLAHVYLTPNFLILIDTVVITR